MRDTDPTPAERKRILRDARRREERARRKKPRAGASSLPKHLQPDFTPMSRSRTGGKRREFY